MSSHIKVSWQSLQEIKMFEGVKKSTIDYKAYLPLMIDY